MNKSELIEIAAKEVAYSKVAVAGKKSAKKK